MRSSSFMTQYKSFTTSHFDVEWNGKRQRRRRRLRCVRVYCMGAHIPCSSFHVSCFYLCVMPHAYTGISTGTGTATYIRIQFRPISSHSSSMPWLSRTHTNRHKKTQTSTQPHNRLSQLGAQWECVPERVERLCQQRQSKQETPSE